MASILRSSKFVRYFAGVARNFLYNTTRETEGSVLQQSQCLCSGLSQNFTTGAPKLDQNLEKSLKRLDQDVRRSGRISRRDIEEVLEEIRLQRSATSSQSLLVIRCCGNLVPEERPEVRTSLVQEIWRTLNSLNIPMDISHYNALLRVYLENEHSFAPTEFLADLEAKGVEPNRVTYQRLISRYCQQGDIEGATRILEFMREKQHPVNENVFNALIMGHSQSDDMESAAGILTVMQQAGLEPSADTYTTLLCGYAKKGDVDAIQKTMAICEEKELFLLDKDLFEIVYALASNGHGAMTDPIINCLRKSAGYNQDAVNVILRLVNKGQEEVALKLLRTMTRNQRPSGDTVDTGNFFIRHLVRSKRPVDGVINICKELQQEGLNARALLVAVEAALDQGVEIAMPLLQEAKASGLEIRQHYFWPIICSEAKKGPTKLLHVLRVMQSDFDLTPNSETIREYVVPNLTEKNPEKLVETLRNVGVSTSNSVTSVVFHLLTQNKLKEAADIATRYSIYFAPSLYRRPLVLALAATSDFESYIRLIRQIHDHLPRRDLLNRQDEVEGEADPSEAEAAVNNSAQQADILGQMVTDAVMTLRKNRVEGVHTILAGLVEQGLTISNSQAERIQDRLGSELTADISKMLGQLASGELEPSVLEPQAQSQSRGGSGEMSVEQLERIIATVEAKGENAKGLKRQLLAACFRSRSIAKAEEVVARLEAEGYTLTSGVYAQLIDLYVQNEQLDQARAIFEKIRTKEPEFTLDQMKTVRMVGLMVAQNAIDEALAFLELNKTSASASALVEDAAGETTPLPDRSFNYTTTCWRILNALAEKGNSADLTRVFDKLVELSYIEPNNVLLGPLVKVHLVNNEIASAVDTFEQITTKHRSTPWKNELACRLIQAEDATNLQRLTDLSTNIHGEVNSLYDLVFSFVECGRIRQARKILETPGLRHRPQRINNACERYRQEGMVTSLEGLAEATKDLNHIDRGDIFYNLLLTYVKSDEPDKALGLWTKMQEESIEPSDAFLLKLGDFLRAKGYEVPFATPAVQQKQPSTAKTIESAPKPQKSTKSTKQKPQLKTASAAAAAAATAVAIESSEMSGMRQALHQKNVDGALKAYEQMADQSSATVNDQSQLIEALVKDQRLNEASKIVLAMLAANRHPLPRVFRFYLNRMAIAGEADTIAAVGKYLDADTKRTVSFDNRFCHSNIVAGRTVAYLATLEREANEAITPEQIAEVNDKFPRGGAIGILESAPELSDQFEKMAERFTALNSFGPMNVLWMHHFVAGNDADASRLWTKYLSQAPRLMFQHIVQKAREANDEKLIERLIGLLKTTPISEGALGNAYSCLLDVCSAKERYADGLEHLKQAISDVCLENINRTALMRLKAGVEKGGQKFPYAIPNRSSSTSKQNADTTSSSSGSGTSSSDDEETVQKKAH